MRHPINQKKPNPQKKVNSKNKRQKQQRENNCQKQQGEDKHQEQKLVKQLTTYEFWTWWKWQNLGTCELEEQKIELEGKTKRKLEELE